MFAQLAIRILSLFSLQVHKLHAFVDARCTLAGSGSVLEQAPPRLLVPSFANQVPSFANQGSARASLPARTWVIMALVPAVAPAAAAIVPGDREHLVILRDSLLDVKQKFSTASQEGLAAEAKKDARLEEVREELAAEAKKDARLEAQVEEQQQQLEQQEQQQLEQQEQQEPSELARAVEAKRRYWDECYKLVKQEWLEEQQQRRQEAAERRRAQLGF